MRILLLTSIIFIVVSCKKEQTFNHNQATIIYPCSCCEIADSIQGDYIGRVIERTHVWSFALDDYTYDTITDDSIAFTITRIFDDIDFISDSLVCKFDIPEYFTEPIQLIENTGQFIPRQYYGQGFHDGNFFLRNETYVNKMFSYTSFRLNATKQ